MLSCDQELLQYLLLKVAPDLVVASVTDIFLIKVAMKLLEIHCIFVEHEMLCLRVKLFFFLYHNKQINNDWIAGIIPALKKF